MVLQEIFHSYAPTCTKNSSFSPKKIDKENRYFFGDKIALNIYAYIYIMNTTYVVTVIYIRKK